MQLIISIHFIARWKDQIAPIKTHIKLDKGKNDIKTNINIMIIYIRDSIVFIEIVFKFLWSFFSIITLIFLCLTIVLPMFFTHHLNVYCMRE